jgi:hypothetical protein
MKRIESTDRITQRTQNDFPDRDRGPGYIERSGNDNESSTLLFGLKTMRKDEHQNGVTDPP